MGVVQGRDVKKEQGMLCFLVCGKCLELLCFAVIGQFYEF